MLAKLSFGRLRTVILESPFPKSAAPEGSVDEDTWMKLLSMTEKLEYNSGKVRLICDP